MLMLRRVAFASLCLCWLVGARTGDVPEYDGSDVSSEEGIVILHVDFKRSAGGMSRAVNRDAGAVTGVLRDTNGKLKMRVADIEHVKAFVLPVGRWYLEQLQTPSERDWPTIARRLQSFEVTGGNINYAGVYAIEFATDSSGRQSANVSVTYDEEPLKAMADAWPEQFKKRQLVYCPVGRKCKLPSEFHM